MRMLTKMSHYQWHHMDSMHGKLDRGSVILLKRQARKREKRQWRKQAVAEMRER